jgi:hypothetical protein
VDGGESRLEAEEILQEETIPRRVGESHDGTPHSKAPIPSSDTILCWIGEIYKGQKKDLRTPETEETKGRGAVCVHQEMSKQALCVINAVHIFVRHMQQPPGIVQHVYENTQNVTTID